MKTLFIGALLLTILHSVMFWGQDIIGISVLIFNTVLLFYVNYMLKQNEKIKNEKAKLLIIPILLLSSTYFIFNNELFRALNIIIIPILTLIMLMLLVGKEFTFKKLFTGIFIYLFKPFSKIDYMSNQCIQAFPKRNTEDRGKRKENTWRIVKALLITIPVVLIVIALLSTADVIFADLTDIIMDSVKDILENISIISLIFRIIIGFIIFLYICGFMYVIINEKEEEKEIVQNNKKSSDDLTAKILLTSLNVIYLLFCALQIRYLVAGPMINDDFIYSNYAREGFFELMIVSFINFVTILVIKRNSKNEKFEDKKFINIMCILMLVFTLIILISSFARMNLYESQYGYTVLRLLVYFTLITEAILIIPTIIYIIKPSTNLTRSYFIIMITMYTILNFANIDKMIAKRNIDRYMETGKIDKYYLQYNIGTDAIGEITRLLNEEPEDPKTKNVKSDIRRYLETKLKSLEDEDNTIWEFNLSKYRARNEIKKHFTVKSEIIPQTDLINRI